MDLSRLLPGPLCDEAREWLKTQPNASTAWRRCKRGDWMLYQLAHHRGVDRKQLVLATCECARLALHRVPAGEHRPRLAIETAEAWCRGEATVDQLREARSAAHDATTTAVSATATAAARATFFAAFTAEAATFFAASRAATVCTLAAANAAAADYGADYGARDATLARCAAIVRRYFPTWPKAQNQETAHG